MALPYVIDNTNSIASTALNVLGPFQSSGGNYYFICIDVTTTTTIKAYKATSTPESTWSNVASVTGYSTAVLLLNGVQRGDVIHMALTDGTVNTSINVKYLTFDMSSDSFPITETVASGMDVSGQVGGYPNPAQVQVCYRESDSQPICFFHGTHTKTSGKFYARVYYSKRTGAASWTAATMVQATTPAADTTVAGAAIGSSNRVHFIHYNGTDGGLQRTLNSSDVLQTQVNMGGGVDFAQTAGSYVRASDGVTEIWCTPNLGATNGGMYFDSADVPSSPGPAQFVYSTEGGGGVWSVRFMDSNGILFAVGYGVVAGPIYYLYWDTGPDVNSFDQFGTLTPVPLFSNIFNLPNTGSPTIAKGSNIYSRVGRRVMPLIYRQLVPPSTIAIYYDEIPLDPPQKVISPWNYVQKAVIIRSNFW